jgi:sialic acid synthase SpsE/RimJ/RimL family protein N-acetyltransferase
MSDGNHGISFEICRPVQGDAELVMAWRNDATTLSMSFHQEPKEWQAFWPEFLDSYFVHSPVLDPVFALADGERVAFLRFRPVDHPQGLSGLTVDISINVAPHRRGRGVGKRVLIAAQRYLLGRGVESVYAEILSHNHGSARVFQAAGFSRIGERNKLVEDTGSIHPISFHVIDMVSTRWRRGRAYVVAEAGSNWRMGTAKRDLAMARALIDVAAKAGADAVKFQTYRPESVYVANAGQSGYLSQAGIEEDIQHIFADLAMPYEMIPELADHCRSLGIDFMSTPFSAADFAAIDPFVASHKIASYEISHVHLLRLAGRSGKPLILSTGASEERDIAWAVATYTAAGGKDLCLLQCTAKYPAPMSSLNLNTIPWIRQRFGVSAGLSDHSREPAVGPVMAIALGARVIEKHFTLDNRLPGPDHSFALTPEELTRMVQEVRMAEEALGSGRKQVLAAEGELAAYARRGLQATRPIQAGEALNEGRNFAVLRPGQQRLGLHPRHLHDIEGRITSRAIGLGQGLSFDDVAD